MNIVRQLRLNPFSSLIYQEKLQVKNWDLTSQIILITETYRQV